MSIFHMAYDFIVSLIGSDLAATPRGAIVCEYFGYFVVGAVLYFLCRLCFHLISFPFKVFR